MKKYFEKKSRNHVSLSVSLWLQRNEINDWVTILRYFWHHSIIVFANYS